MHDFVTLDTLDTQVADDPDTPAPLPRVSRTRSDGVATMQVLIDGEYHRRTPDLAHTACGRDIPTQFAPLRREALEGQLCDICFTSFECQRAIETNAKRTNGTL